MKVHVLNNNRHSQHVNHFITNSCRRSSDPLQWVDAGVPLKGVLTSSMKGQRNPPPPPHPTEPLSRQTALPRLLFIPRLLSLLRVVSVSVLSAGSHEILLRPRVRSCGVVVHHPPCRFAMMATRRTLRACCACHVKGECYLVGSAGRTHRDPVNSPRSGSASSPVRHRRAGHWC